MQLRQIHAISVPGTKARGGRNKRTEAGRPGPVGSSSIQTLLSVVEFHHICVSEELPPSVALADFTAGQDSAASPEEAPHHLALKKTFIFIVLRVQYITFPAKMQGQVTGKTTIFPPGAGSGPEREVTIRSGNGLGRLPEDAAQDEVENQSVHHGNEDP